MGINAGQTILVLRYVCGLSAVERGQTKHVCFQRSMSMNSCFGLMQSKAVVPRRRMLYGEFLA